MEKWVFFLLDFSTLKMRQVPIFFYPCIKNHRIVSFHFLLNFHIPCKLFPSIFFFFASSPELLKHACQNLRFFLLPTLGTISTLSKKGMFLFLYFHLLHHLIRYTCVLVFHRSQALAGHMKILRLRKRTPLMALLILYGI